MFWGCCIKSLPVGIYLLKDKNRNTRTSCEICSKLTIKRPEWRQWGTRKPGNILLWGFMQRHSKTYEGSNIWKQSLPDVLQIGALKSFANFTPALESLLNKETLKRDSNIVVFLWTPPVAAFEHTKKNHGPLWIFFYLFWCALRVIRVTFVKRDGLSEV